MPFLLRLLRSVGFYLAVAVLATAAGVLFGALGVPGKWPNLVLITLVTFGILVWLNRQHWGRWSFWTTIMALCVIHTFAYVSLLMRVERWPSSLFLMVFLLEVGAVHTVLATLFARPAGG